MTQEGRESGEEVVMILGTLGADSGKVKGEAGRGGGSGGGSQ